MTKRNPSTDDTQIGALNKQRAGSYDLMRPGPGTPWENRGETGLIVAFFKTIGRALSSPMLLVDHIRRPETSGDVNQFVIGCGLMLSLAVLTQSAVWFTQARSAVPKDTIDGPSYWEGTILLAVVMPAIWWLLMRIGCKVYILLVTGDNKQKAPPVLFQNVLGYTCAPIVLAVVPYYVGLLTGIVWLMALWINAGSRRLYIKPAATTIATIGAVIAMGVVGAGIIFGLYFLMYSYGFFGGAILQPIPTPGKHL
jgi:hypothetical protein